MITDFQVGQDALITTWEDSEGNSLADVKITEAKGWTKVTITDVDDHSVLGIIDIHAVGIPATSYHDIFSWGA